jgi:hypothetical protein
LYPIRSTCYRDFSHGGIRLADIRSQLTALRAKIIGRFLEPEYLPWKAYMAFWLYRPRECLPVPYLFQQQHVRQRGSFLPFSTFDLAGMQAPTRVIQYLAAFRQLHPH